MKANREKQTNAHRVIFALCALLIAVLTACPGDEDKEPEFVPGPTNPIITDRFTADPAAFVDRDTVYLVCGEDVFPPDLVPGATGEWYRIKQWLIYSTKDMKNFKFEKVLMKSEDFTYGQPNSAWASQAIQGLDGRYYFYGTVMYNSLSNEAISVASADSPTGLWKQVGNTPLVTSTMANADTPTDPGINIDPTVFIDDDDSAWVCWSQTRPRIAKLDDSMTKIDRNTSSTDPAKKIRFLFPTTWTSVHRYTEGPFLYKRGNIYYLFYASMVVQNGSDFAETISYSMAVDTEGVGLEGLIGKDNVWSDGVPITDFAPGLDGKGNCFTIHPAILDFKGQTYLFYHNAALKGVKQENDEVWNGSSERRSLCVDYLYFNEDGTVKLFDNPDPNGRVAKIAVDVRNPAGLSVPPKKF